MVLLWVSENKWSLTRSHIHIILFVSWTNFHHHHLTTSSRRSRRRSKFVEGSRQIIILILNPNIVIEREDDSSIIIIDMVSSSHLHTIWRGKRLVVSDRKENYILSWQCSPSLIITYMTFCLLNNHREKVDLLMFNGELMKWNRCVSYPPVFFISNSEQVPQIRWEELWMPMCIIASLF